MDGAKKRNLGKEVDDIAVSIARRAESVRKANGVSRAAIGAALAVGEQQVKKLLRGETHLSAARLVVLSGVLGAPISAILSGVMEPGRAQELTGREERLVRVFRLLDSRDQDAVLVLAEALQGGSMPDPHSKI